MHVTAPYLHEYMTVEVTWQKWKDASISALSIPIDEDTPITWKEWCLTEGRKLGKNLLEIRYKYLEAR